MRSVSVLCWLTVVGVGALLSAGSALPLTTYKWKILSQATGRYVGVTDDKTIRGDLSPEDATLFYIKFEGDSSSLDTWVTVSTTEAPILYLNIDSKTGKLQASPNPNNGILKNTVFKIEQPDISDIQLVMNVTLELPCEGSGEQSLLVTEEESVEEGKLCAVVKECGVAFDDKIATPIRCQDQGDIEDQLKNLTFEVHLPFLGFFS